MIRMIQSSSAAQAKSYYSDALLKSDYYLEDQEVGGEFGGRLATRLGLSGRATKEDFFALCENRNPLTGEQLTPRTKDNRTTGYDFNFHVSKSVSIVHALSKDDHILKAFQSSVRDTMTDIEADAKARIRKGKIYDDRHTGELVWTDFYHQTSRPVPGHNPDPHLHAHVYIFNVTYDGEEDTLKAVQFRDIVRDNGYYAARFQKRFSDRLIELGYDIRKTKKSFEIEGIPQRVIDYMSKRTEAIGKVAKELGLKDAEALDRLGARTRAKKQKDLSMQELKADWRDQIHRLGGLKSDGDKPVRYGPARDAPKGTIERGLGFSLSHHFEKASVVPSRKLLATAFMQSIGDKKASMQETEDRLAADPSIIQVNEKGRMVCTTRAVLSEEQRMVELAQSGRGRMNPIYSSPPAIKLDGAQGKAVAHVLTTPDQVTIIRGAAGTGKTTLMQEAVQWMQKKGKTVTVVAPTAVAARDVLRKEGFAEANTIAAFLQNEEKHNQLHNGVLWVDEAGMIGTREMTEVLALAKKWNARVVLGGDQRQHSSVERGDALRIISKLGRVKTAEVSKIYRQKSAEYRDAVQSLSNGEIKEGFDRLDKMDAIITIDPKKPNDNLVTDYIRTIKQGKTALIISPTNVHRQELTDAIRQELRSNGMLGKKEILVDRLDNLYLSRAEKDSWKNYECGQVIQFVQHTSGIKRGSQWTVKQVTEKAIVISDSSGKTTSLPQGRSGSFDVLKRTEIPLSKGDKVKVTRNSYDKSNRRMDNGQMLEVVGVRKDGRVELQNTVSKQHYHIDDHFGHLDHAHCVTSYASQGKTVDNVFVAQPAATFPATNSKQFYVSVSRAREGIRIYTDDKEELLVHAQRIGDRTSAMEISALQQHEEATIQIQRNEYAGPLRKNEPTVLKRPEIDRYKIDRDYEPGL